LETACAQEGVEEVSWQEQQAAAYDHYVADHDRALAELDNLEAMYEGLGDTRMLTETRSYAGGVRSARNDLARRARQLRRVDEPPVMPMSITSRAARR
jgi:hypothetical protein